MAGDVLVNGVALSEGFVAGVTDAHITGTPILRPVLRPRARRVGWQPRRRSNSRVVVVRGPLALVPRHVGAIVKGDGE